MKYTIKKEETNGGTYNYINFRAYDSKGKRIFGAEAQASQHKDGWLNDSKWEAWTASWGSCSGDIEDMQIQLDCIQQAVTYALKANKK